MKTKNPIAPVIGLSVLQPKTPVTIRILLRSRPKASFVSGGLDWSPFAGNADVFPNARAADEFVRSHGLLGMEIVVLRENGPPMRIPMDRTCHRPEVSVLPLILRR